MKGEGLGDYPRLCSTCGQPVRITGPESLTFEWTPKHGKRSWHTRCLTSAPGRTVASPASHKDDCDPSGVVAEVRWANRPPRPYTHHRIAVAPTNGGDMPETPEPPQPEPEPDDGNGDEDE